MMRVFVLASDGQPLMPTSRCGKVYRLLKSGKAKLVRREPFVIQLLYEPETRVVQEIVESVDTGSKTIGVACCANGEILYQSEVQVRTDIKGKMDGRRAYRRNRRSRKTRYRKPRFLNRKSSTRLDRLPPSVRHKVQAHIDEIEFCKSILPVSKIVLEVSQFDPHLMKNPALLDEKIRHWGYQKGFAYGYSSLTEAIRHRDGYKCQHCGKRHVRLEVHHIIFRSDGGTDVPENLITLCHDCHTDLHNGLFVLKKKPSANLNLKHATHMNIIRSQLLKRYPDAIETFGFVTKENRHNLHLGKAHYIDACVVASGGKPFKPCGVIYRKKRVSKGDYQLCKGSRGELKIPTWKIQGFRKFDKVRYFGTEYFIKGRYSTGYAILMDIQGNTIKFENAPKGFKTPKLSNCVRISTRGPVLCTIEKIA